MRGVFWACQGVRAGTESRNDAGTLTFTSSLIGGQLSTIRPRRSIKIALERRSGRHGDHSIGNSSGREFHFAFVGPNKGEWKQGRIYLTSPSPAEIILLVAGCAIFARAAWLAQNPGTISTILPN